MTGAAPDRAAPVDPVAVLRSPGYTALLVFGALIGIPIAGVAYFFLAAIEESQDYLFTTLPENLGFDGQPAWWPIPLLALGGLIVGLTVRYLPGTAGERPAQGFQSGGPVRPIELPGIAIAAFASLSLGVVLGPEAPLIAIGSGLGVVAVRLVKRDAPDRAVMVIAAAGSFAAIATLLGSPLAAAFLLMEAAGLGGPMMGVVLVPGLLAAGIGSLIFVGLDNWTGLGTFSLSVSDLPAAASPTVAAFLWAVVIGVLAAALGFVIRRGALTLEPIIERRAVTLTPFAGAAIGIFVLVFVVTTDRPADEVLFSGQDALAPLLQDTAAWTVGALVLLVACKSLAYMVALSCFRGGPVFPALFIGAVGGIALSHLPGLDAMQGAAMGIGAMAVAMLNLPLLSVLLVALFLQQDAVQLVPLVIVAVAVSYVVSARLRPASA